MSLDQKLDAILLRREELENLLQSAPPERYASLAKEYAGLEPVVAGVQAFRQAARELDEVEEVLHDRDADREMRALALEERELISERLPLLERQVKLLLLPKDIADEKSAILEIRAGTGGDEAALFAGDLVQMYQRYAQLRDWKVETIALAETDLGGIKEVQLEVKGAGAFARLKFEAGVHRVQRVPSTEAGGRIHTSAATVAVLPEADEVDVEIDDSDLEIDVYRASGAGGQHVNRTESAVRITHRPSGIVVAQQDERSQHRNKARAMQILRAKLFDIERTRAAADRAADRRGQVGSGDRSERIRTYNFPQNRVTDHRINLTLYKLEQIVAGEGLDELVEALIAEDQASRLAEVS